MLVLAGLAASLIPGVIEVTFDPQVVLLLVLTPLLYSAALDSSYLGIRANKRPIGLLAVGLVTFTAVVVGVVASWLIPGLPLAAGLVLGAVVAPPDAVSALAVGRRLNLPRRVMTILGGESLINDATALTLFRVFLAVAAGTGVTVWGAAGMFVLAAVGGTAVGLAVGWVVHRIRRRLDDPPVESALGLVVPFGVYLLAESVHGSGLLAVVVAGLYLGYRSPESGYATRLQDGRAVAGERHDPGVGGLRPDRPAAHGGGPGGGRHPRPPALRPGDHGGDGAGPPDLGVPGDLPASGALPRDPQDRSRRRPGRCPR